MSLNRSQIGALIRQAWSEITSYRPGIERLVFGLASLGLLDVGYLWIQKTRGFENGCSGVGNLGLSKAGSGTSSSSLLDCEAVTSGVGSELLGIDNLVWGAGFYLTVMGLTAALLWAGQNLRRWIVAARAAGIVGGALYSTYLTGLQLLVIDGLCVPCLISAALACGLFGVLVAVALGTGSAARIGKKTWVRQAKMFIQASGASLIFLIGSAFYAHGDILEGGAERRGLSCSLVDQPPMRDEGRHLSGSKDITAGPANSAVTMIEFFDPNCPHCKDFHEVLQKVLEEHGENVRLTYKPFPLNGESLPEIQALYLAEKAGKFEEMLEAQYQRQEAQQGGITPRDLREIAEKIGMDGTKMLRGISAGRYQRHVLAGRQKAIKLGVKKTPTLLINGHIVESKSPECLRHFIEQAQHGTL